MPARCRRVFILGAGFSKSAGMPLATELTDLLINDQRDEFGTGANDQQNRWLDEFLKRMRNLQGGCDQAVNVEQFFEYAAFDREILKMQQQLCQVGRGYGTTPWNVSQDIDSVLQDLQERIVGVMVACQKTANLSPIRKFAANLHPSDAVITFNYDTLVEAALDELCIPWTHGFAESQRNAGEPIHVLKMHGSIDWITANRGKGQSQKLLRLFSKVDTNVTGENSYEPDEVEREYWRELHRCEEFDDVTTFDQHLKGAIDSSGADYDRGIGGLGSFKSLHALPGSATVWAKAINFLQQTERIIFVGFSLSPYDAMVRMQFGSTLSGRIRDACPPKEVRIIAPNASSLAANYASILGTSGDLSVHFDDRYAERVDWERL